MSEQTIFNQGISNQEWQMVSEAIMNGIDPACPNSDGVNAFDILLSAVGYGESYEKIVNEKIFSKDKINIQAEVDNLLRAFVKKEVYFSQDNFNRNKWPYFALYIQKLFEAGANPYAHDSLNQTALSIAANNPSTFFDASTRRHQQFFPIMLKSLYECHKLKAEKKSITNWGSLFYKRQTSKPEADSPSEVNNKMK